MPLNEAVRHVRATHPLLRDLYWRRRPRGRTLAVVEALVNPPQGARVMLNDESLNMDGLPPNAFIARQLGMSEKTVKEHIAKAARDVNGLWTLRARARIYGCYHHDRWCQQNDIPSSTQPTPPLLGNRVVRTRSA